MERVKRNEKITEENRSQLKRQEREKWLRELHGGIDKDGKYIEKDKRIRGLAIVEVSKLKTAASTGVVDAEGKLYLDEEIKEVAGTWTLAEMLARLNPKAASNKKPEASKPIITQQVSMTDAEVMRILCGS